MAEEGHDDGGLGVAGWLHNAFDVVASGAGAALEHAEVAGAAGLGALGLALGPAGMALGAHETAEGVAEGDAAKAARGGLEVLGGAAGTTEGVAAVAAGAGVEGAAGLAAAAGPVAAVAGAGAAGLGIGSAMAKVADGDSTKSGFWGKDEATGENKSAMDWGAGLGTSVDKFLGNTEPSVAGGVAAGVGGILGGVGGTAQSLWNWATG